MNVLVIFLLCAVHSVAPQNNVETQVLNAAFEDVAPCPCDLTRDSCDTGCCCDAKCTEDQKGTFGGCIPFLAGGQDGEVQQYKCASTHHQKEDWFPLLCVVFEYNAFLGYYFNWQLKLSNNTQTFLERLNTVSYYWYREQESRVISDTSSSGYKYGTSVKTSKPLTSTAKKRKGTLVLPQLTLYGQCLETAPVRYLQNLEHSCTYTMSNSLCSESSILSQLYFIQDSRIGRFFSVLEADMGIVIAETTVTYKCVDAAFLNSYLKSNQVLSDISDPSQISSPYVDPSCIGSCGKDLCVDLYTADTAIPPTVLTDCASQTPSSPRNNNSACENSVIDVDYTLYWAGDKIARLDAIVIMADVPFQNNGVAPAVPNVLSQKYKVKYIHNDTSVATGTIDNFNNITDTSYQRSGKVGYDKGKDLFSGSLVTNTSVSPAEFQFVNSNSSRQMAVFNPTADGLCVNAGRRTIKFGEDITTACKLQLDMSNFTDCTSLRSYMIYYLNSLMPSDVLGRRGYNDPYNTGYWISVLREDLTEFCTLSEYFPLGLSPVDNRTGICHNITRGITLDILYAETGQSNGYPIYEVMGSRVSYSNTTWKVQCSGPGGGACSDTRTQSFFLTSSVKFTQIPPQIPEPVSKYYETPREEDKELCPQARCWDDLFYPFTNRYQTDTKEYVFGMVSFSIIFFVGYGLVTRPWW